MRLEIISRNAARPVPPPKVAITEATTLNADQISEVLMGLQGYLGRYGSLPLHPIAVLAIGTGMRRGEICGLSWGAVDLDKARVRIECSLEETADGLRFKSPKTAHCQPPCKCRCDLTRTPESSARAPPRARARTPRQ
jgi:hypothetical protein